MHRSGHRSPARAGFLPVSALMPGISAGRVPPAGTSLGHGGHDLGCTNLPLPLGSGGALHPTWLFRRPDVLPGQAPLNSGPRLRGRTGRVWLWVAGGVALMESGSSRFAPGTHGPDVTNRALRGAPKPRTHTAQPHTRVPASVQPVRGLRRSSRRRPALRSWADPGPSAASPDRGPALPSAQTASSGRGRQGRAPGHISGHV